MAWIVLVVSAIFEAVWAVALDKSQAFSRLVPSLVFLGAGATSMGGLAWALKSLPVGTSYAVWVSIGAALTVTYSMATGEETASVLKIVLLLGLVGCVVGLRLAD